MLDDEDGEDECDKWRCLSVVLIVPHPRPPRHSAPSIAVINPAAAHSIRVSTPLFSRFAPNKSGYS